MTLSSKLFLKSCVLLTSRRCHTTPLYVQGQEPEKGVREYFYFVDHQGMLFLDDAKIKNFTSCFKDKQFLSFFFRRIKRNNTGRYHETFPFWSDCGKERNYIRGDDYPVVFTHIAKKLPRGKTDFEEHLFYGYAGDNLSFKFNPEKIYMSHTGRVYHPGPENAGSVGLISSKLSIEISKFFIFETKNHSGPSGFVWNGQLHKLDHQWFASARAASSNFE